MEIENNKIPLKLIDLLIYSFFFFVFLVFLRILGRLLGWKLYGYNKMNDWFNFRTFSGEATIQYMNNLKSNLIKNKSQNNENNENNENENKEKTKNKINNNLKKSLNESINNNNIISKLYNKIKSIFILSDIYYNSDPLWSQYLTTKPHGVWLQCCHFSHQGLRRYMEDRYAIEGDIFNGTKIKLNNNILNNNNEVKDDNDDKSVNNKEKDNNIETKISFYGVFDGHGGARAAEFSIRNFPLILARNTNLSTNPGLALRETFINTDRQFLQIAEAEGYQDGTTGCVALIYGDKLLIGNCGDSRAILIKSGGRVRALSRDHKPSLPDERKRITEMGGKVIWKGLWRVSGVLAVSRAIGDIALKPFVTSEPDIFEYTLIPEEDLYIVIASDGIWDAMTNQDVASYVSTHPDFTEIAHGLCTKSLMMGSHDNATVIVIDLKDLANDDI